MTSNFTPPVGNWSMAEMQYLMQALRDYGPQSSIGQTLQRGIASTVVQCVGDSTTYGTYSWPAQALLSAARRYPNLNMQFVQWYQASTAAPLEPTSRYRSYRYMQQGVGGPRGTRYVNAAPSPGPHSVPTAPALTSTAIDIRVEVALDNWASGARQVLVSRWGTPATNERQFWFGIGAGGDLQAGVSVDGNIAETTVASTATPALQPGAKAWLRCTIESNVAGARRYQFFTGAESGSDSIAWTPIGTPVTAAGTAAFNPTCVAPLMFGGRFVSTFYQEKPFGTFYWVDVRSGGVDLENGEIICPPLLERWDYSITSSDANVFTDGDPAIVLYGGGMPGQEIGIFQNPLVFSKLHPVLVRPDEFWLNDGHNEGDVTNQDWVDLLDGYLAQVEARYAPIKRTSFVASAQNPVVPAAQVRPPLTQGYSPGAIRKRETRNAVLRAAVHARPRWRMVDSRGAFLNANNLIRDPLLWNSDGLHPSSSLGGPVQGDHIAKQLFPDVMTRPPLVG